MIYLFGILPVTMIYSGSVPLLLSFVRDLSRSFTLRAGSIPFFFFFLSGSVPVMLSAGERLLLLMYHRLATVVLAVLELTKVIFQLGDKNDFVVLSRLK